MLFFEGRACTTDFWGKAFVYIGGLLSLSLPPPLLVPLSVLLWLPWPSPLPLLLSLPLFLSLLCHCRYRCPCVWNSQPLRVWLLQVQAFKVHALQVQPLQVQALQVQPLKVQALNALGSIPSVRFLFCRWRFVAAVASAFTFASCFASVFRLLSWYPVCRPASVCIV